jgi:hypothetical protein
MVLFSINMPILLGNGILSKAGAAVFAQRAIMA